MGGAAAGGAAGKGGAASGGAAAGGAASGGAGAGGSAGKSSTGGAVGSGGASGGGTCDAAHSVATVTTSTTYTGKANDCITLSVNKTYATVNIQMQALPGTVGYPVPFTYSSCLGSGSGSLTADFAQPALDVGTNPECDFYVQFTGGATELKFTYYD